MTRTRATLTGLLAVLSWSALALLTVRTAPVPPFLLVALTFGLGGLAGAALALATGRGRAVLAASPGAMAFMVAGLFGYHLCYFAALRLAPAAEAGLVAYLWPLLIVLGSGLLPGERLRWPHALGAASAFAGVAVLLGGVGRPGAGIALAGVCAVVWAAYSLGSRRLGAVPSEAVALACLVSAGLAGVAHLGLEETAWPVGRAGWAAVVLLGLGPLGLGFVAWDVGVKRGDIQLLGTASYAAPLLSTALLVLAGEARATPALGGAALLVTAGAALAGVGV